MEELNDVEVLNSHRNLVIQLPTVDFQGNEVKWSLSHSKSVSDKVFI